MGPGGKTRLGRAPAPIPPLSSPAPSDRDRQLQSRPSLLLYLPKYPSALCPLLLKRVFSRPRYLCPLVPLTLPYLPPPFSFSLPHPSYPYSTGTLATPLSSFSPPSRPLPLLFMSLSSPLLQPLTPHALVSPSVQYGH
jgi:hypothetical protein